MTRLNLTLVENDKAQFDTCTRLNLSFDKVQFDTIKDKLKDNGEVDKGGEVKPPKGALTSLEDSPGVEIDGIAPVVMTGAQALEEFGETACTNRIKTALDSCYWISGKLIKLV